VFADALFLLLQQAVTFDSESQARYEGHTSLTFDEFTLLATPLLEQQVQQYAYYQYTHTHKHIITTVITAVISDECSVTIATLARSTPVVCVHCYPVQL
jgi:hypothetical protein